MGNDIVERVCTSIEKSYAVVCYAVMWCGMECMVCYDISKLGINQSILHLLTLNLYFKNERIARINSGALAPE